MKKIQIDWSQEEVIAFYKKENDKNPIMSINGEKVDEIYEIQGRFMLLVSMIQALLDSYAKWVNTSLLAGKRYHKHDCNIGNLCKRINEIKKSGTDLSFCMDFLEGNVLSLGNREEYLYINSLNNIIKHQRIIKVDSFIDGTYRIKIPKFNKKAKDSDYIYESKYILVELEKCLKYFCKLVRESEEYIINLYKANTNPFTFGRSHEVGYFQLNDDSNICQNYFFISEKEVNKKGNTYLLLKGELDG